jgi:hypothetical protein
MKEIIQYIVVNFGVDSNTSSSIIITLFVFLLSQILIGLSKFVRRLREKNEYKKSMLFVIKDFARTCEKQYSVTLKSVKSISSTSEINISFSTIALNSIDFLNNLDLNIFFQNFNKVWKPRLYSKSVSKLFSIINQIKVLNDNESDVFYKYMENYTRYQDSYNENIIKLREIRDELGLKYNGQPVVNRHLEFVVHYNYIFETWVANGQTLNYKSTYANIVLNIVELNKAFQDVPIILDINKYVTNCRRAYNNMINQERILESNFLHFAYSHRSAFKVINKIIIPNLKYGYITYNINILKRKYKLSKKFSK